MNKKWMIPLIPTLMFSLTACGNGANDVDKTTTTTQESNTDKTNGVEQESTTTEESNKNQETTKNTDTDQTQINRATVVDGVNYGDAKVDTEQAFSKFMRTHGDAKVTEIKFDTKYNELEYKIEGYDASNEYQVRINAVTGEITSDDTKNLDKEDKDDGIIEKGEINKVNDLIKKAMNDSDDSLKFKKWSLEDNDGKLEFEIEFKNIENKDVEYTYDVNSGELLKKGD